MPVRREFHFRISPNGLDLRVSEAIVLSLAARTRPLGHRMRGPKIDALAGVISAEPWKSPQTGLLGPFRAVFLQEIRLTISPGRPETAIGREGRSSGP